jgi:hypothetical protein
MEAFFQMRGSRGDCLYDSSTAGLCNAILGFHSIAAGEG